MNSSLSVVARAGSLAPWLVVFALGCATTDGSVPSPTDGGLEDKTSAQDGASDDTGAEPGGDSAADAPTRVDGGATDGGSDATLDGAGEADSDAADADDSETAADGGDAEAGPCTPLTGTPIPVSGSIVADTSFACDYLYELTGTVFVEAPATLTIAAGTRILMGDGASLLVKPGARIVAVGARDLPIVFTSAKPAPSPGDWGSLALIGKAPGNWGLDPNGQPITQHVPDADDWPGGFPVAAGGTDRDDSSGTLQYVRLEYGGQPKATISGSVVAAEHETLGMYGVGTGTRIDYIDIRQGAFGCMFAEGGAFDASHLVCQYGGNTAFGFTRGNQSRAQFLIDQENPAQGAEGLGIKGPYDVNQQPPLTDPTIYNVTVCGSDGSPTIPKDPYGLFMKRDPAGHVYNFIASGFRAGLAMTSGAPLDAGGPEGGPAYAVATTELRSSILFGNFDPSKGDAGAGTNISFPGSNDTDLAVWFANPSWNNSTDDPGIGGCFDPSALRFAPAAAITENAATPPSTGFFDPSAAYVGAFRDTSDDWATGAWVVWSAY